MHPTGYEHYIITSKSPQLIAFELFKAILSKWPSALVLNESDEDDPFNGSLPRIEVLPKFNGELYFCRDEEMNDHWDENGYSLLDDGEGPFAFIYSEKSNHNFSFEMIDDFTKFETTGIQCCSESVISAFGMNYFDLILITPADPKDNPFSKWLLESVIQGCKR